MYTILNASLNIKLIFKILNKKIFCTEIKQIRIKLKDNIAKIIDDGIAKKYYVLLPTDATGVSRDSKVKNIRPSEKLITDFLNLGIEVLVHIEKNKLI